MFQTSQHTHAGMMIATDDHQLLRFYDEVLGLKRWFDAERPYGQATGSRTIFGLEPDETHWMVDFDDPRSGHSLESDAQASSRSCGSARVATSTTFRRMSA